MLKGKLKVKSGLTSYYWKGNEHKAHREERYDESVCSH